MLGCCLIHRQAVIDWRKANSGPGTSSPGKLGGLEPQQQYGGVTAAVQWRYSQQEHEADEAVGSHQLESQLQGKAGRAQAGQGG